MKWLIDVFLETMELYGADNYFFDDNKNILPAPSHSQRHINLRTVYFSYQLLQLCPVTLGKQQQLQAATVLAMNTSSDLIQKQHRDKIWSALY